MQVASGRGDDITAVVIGAGWAGRRQLEAAQELGRDVRFVGLVEPDREHGRAVADEFGVVVYPDLTAALADDDVDAVSVCAPHDLHRPLAIEAMRAGKHVLCEKPLARTVADATVMIDEATQSGVVLHVNEQAAYEPVVDDLRRLVSEGVAGEIVSASLMWGFASNDFSYSGRRHWLTEPEQGGTGTWMLHGVHMVAQARAMLGEVRSVAAVGYTTSGNVRRDLVGSMRALLTMESGWPLDVLVTSESPIPGRWQWCLCGSEAMIVASTAGITCRRGEQTTDLPLTDPGLSPYAVVLADFSSSVRGGLRGRTDGHSERRSLAVVEAADAAAMDRRQIDLVEHFGPL